MSETSQTNYNPATRKKRSFSVRYRAVGMISFVDVLANGLIVMMLLIFITLKINKEIKQEEEQSMREIGVMMSRKIAANLTSNAIPTNPPAFLHDYKNSTFDVYPEEHIMPIIEIHENFVRFYYSGKTVAYQLLFEDDNGLDYYLNNLTREQKMRIRIDIYAIRSYYITMSILKEHGVQIRHWHILGYTSPPPVEDAYKKSDEALKTKENRRDLTSDIAGNTPFGDQKSNSPPRFTLPGDPEALPNMPENETGENSPFSFPELDLTEEEMQALGKFLSELQKMLPNLPPSPNFDGQTPMSREELKKYLEQLAKALTQQGGQEPMFRIPDDTSPQMPFVNPMNPAQANVPDLLVTVTGLLHYLQKKQTNYDNGRMTDISVNEFMLFLGIFQSNPKLMESLPYFPLALNIYSRILNSLNRTDDSGKLNLKQQLTENFPHHNELNMEKNQFPNHSLLLSKKNQKTYPFLENPLPKQTEIILRRYPTYYKGETIKLGDNTIIVVPPNQKEPAKFHWRLIGILRSDLKNTMMGYTYSAFDSQGNMLFPTLENTVKFDKSVVSTIFPEKIFDLNALLLLFYIIVALFMLILFIRKTRI